MMGIRSELNNFLRIRNLISKYLYLYPQSIKKLSDFLREFFENILYPLPLNAARSVISSAYSIEPACGSHFESREIFISFFGLFSMI
jgi:hypothetical protein